MSTINSNEIIAATVPPTRLLSMAERGGRVQTLKFSLDVSAGNTFSSGDYCYLGILPKGARVLGGKFTYAAAGTSATAQIGDLTTTTQIFPATSVASAGISNLAAAASTYSTGVVTAGYGWTVAADTPLYLKAAGANWANGHYEGSVEFVTDAP